MNLQKSVQQHHALPGKVADQIFGEERVIACLKLEYKLNKERFWQKLLLTEVETIKICKFCDKQVLNFNPLAPKSDLHLISPYHITPESNMKVMRREEMTTN